MPASLTITPHGKTLSFGNTSPVVYHVLNNGGLVVLAADLLKKYSVFILDDIQNGGIISTEQS